jgi:hypothetical protein
MKTFFLSAIVLAVFAVSAAEIRVGIVGCDTSHATAFTETWNNPQAKGHVRDSKSWQHFKVAAKTYLRA